MKNSIPTNIILKKTKMIIILNFIFLFLYHKFYKREGVVEYIPAQKFEPIFYPVFIIK